MNANRINLFQFFFFNCAFVAVWIMNVLIALRRRVAIGSYGTLVCTTASCACLVTVFWYAQQRHVPVLLQYSAMHNIIMDNSMAHDP